MERFKNNEKDIEQNFNAYINEYGMLRTAVGTKLNSAKESTYLVTNNVSEYAGPTTG